MRSNLKKIAELKKTRRKDVLVGNLKIEELNINLKLIAFLKTKEQKKNQSDPDVVLMCEDSCLCNVPNKLFD